MADKVKPLKIENAATGGTQTDGFPTEADPTQDYLAAKGIAFENSDTRLFDLSAGGEIQYKDAVQATYKTLNSLVGGSSTIPQLNADPVSPAAQSAWVLTTTTTFGTPIGLLLALTSEVNNYSYSLRYRTLEGTTVSV